MVQPNLADFDSQSRSYVVDDFTGAEMNITSTKGSSGGSCPVRVPNMYEIEKWYLIRLRDDRRRNRAQELID